MDLLAPAYTNTLLQGYLAYSNTSSHLEHRSSMAGSLICMSRAVSLKLKMTDRNSAYACLSIRNCCTAAIHNYFCALVCAVDWPTTWDKFFSKLFTTTNFLFLIHVVNQAVKIVNQEAHTGSIINKFFKKAVFLRCFLSNKLGDYKKYTDKLQKCCKIAVYVTSCILHL